MHKPGWGGKNDNGPESTPVAPPDYLSDLNAMARAEKVIIEKRLWPIYCDHLCRGTPANYPIAIRATAAQRAEAFLKTLSLWDDTK